MKRFAIRSLILVLLFLPAVINAQFDFSYEKLKDEYNKYNALVLEKSEIVEIDIVNDDIKASQHTSEKILILNDHSKIYSGDRIYKSSFSEIKDIDAKTYIPKGNGKYKTMKVSEFNEVDDMRSYVFYDDSKSITFTYPALQEGAITSLDYTTVFSDTRFLQSYIFKSYIPVLKTSLTIKVHKDIKLIIKSFHTENLKFDYSETEKGDFKYYSWTAKNLDAYKTGSERINVMHYSPHIVYYVGNVKINGLNKKQYGTIEDLYKYYLSYIEDIDTSCNTALKEKVDEIVSGSGSELEKVKKILSWVRANIKYIAFEQGMRGFIPDDGCNVYNKKYGDCKDMSSLIVTMLNCAEIKGNIAWTGTRHIPYTYKELPLPKTDNHMVAVYMKDSVPIILDGTINYLAFEYPPYLLQDKELLISLDKENYIVYKVPVLPMHKSIKKSEYQIKIAEDTLKGKGISTYSGYNRSEIRYALSGVKEKDLQKSLIRILTVGSNKFNLDEFDIQEPKNENEPVKIDYDFNVPDYIKSIDDEIYINLNIDKSYSDFKLDTTFSEVPIENDFKFHEICTTELEIPEGFKIEYLPEGTHFENERFHFDIQYIAKGNKIIQEKNIYFNFLVLEKEEFDIWNQMMQSLVEAYREAIVLKEITIVN